jgi:hypothetical protein
MCSLSDEQTDFPHRRRHAGCTVHAQLNLLARRSADKQTLRLLRRSA